MHVLCCERKTTSRRLARAWTELLSYNPGALCVRGHDAFSDSRPAGPFW